MDTNVERPSRGRPPFLPEDRKTRANFTISPDLLDRFRLYCDREGLKMSAVVSSMIEDRINGPR